MVKFSVYLNRHVFVMQTLHSAAFDLDHHCLPITILGVSILNGLNCERSYVSVLYFVLHIRAL